MACNRFVARFFSFAAACAAATSVSSAAAQARRVDLQILVLSTGDSGTAMVKASLDEGLVPYAELNLSDPARPVIDDGFLVDTAQADVRRGRFQAVVLPNEAPPGLTDAEREALVRYERERTCREARW